VHQTLESLLWQSLGKLLHDGDPLTAEEDARLITRLIEVSQQLKLGLSLDSLSGIILLLFP
jgi:hypothetical protein